MPDERESITALQVLSTLHRCLHFERQLACILGRAEERLYWLNSRSWADSRSTDLFSIACASISEKSELLGFRITGRLRVSFAELTEMPLNGGNFNDLDHLTGGVIPRGEGADGQFAVNSARPDNATVSGPLSLLKLYNGHHRTFFATALGQSLGLFLGTRGNSPLTRHIFC